MSKPTLFSLTDIPRSTCTAEVARPRRPIETDRALSAVWNGSPPHADHSRSERTGNQTVTAGTRMAGIGYRFLLATAITLAGLGIGFYAGNTAAPEHAAQDPASTDIAAAPYMLPTVHVSAQAPIPVLPTVMVRASASERAAAQASEPGDALLATADHGGGSDLPHVHLDMPYYSFGKILPRISKE